MPPSPKFARQSDDQILEQRINANKLDYPKNSLVLVAAMCSFQPIYFSHAINGLEWSSPVNAILYLLGAIATTYLLSQSYTVMVDTSFWRRQRHFSEVASEKDEKHLRQLRLQVSMGYALFFMNTAFFAICTCLMAYVFHNTDPRAAYLLSPTLTAAALWLVAQKNEEARQRRMRQHK